MEERRFRSLQDEEDSNALNKVAMTPRRLRKTTLPTTVEKLQEELQNVLLDLEEKQRDATLAAQYGSTLIQANDKLRSELEEMETKLEAAYENMSELHQSLAEQNTQTVQLRTNNSVLTNQIRDAQKENQILLEEFQQLKELFEEEQRKSRTLHALGERKRELEEELEKYYGVEEKIEELEQREASMANKCKRLQQTNQKQLFELTEYRDQLVELSQQLEQQQVDTSKILTLTHQLQQAQRTVEELKEEKRILEEMPLLSQFSETSTLRSLLQKNRALLENVEFSKMEQESKSIVDSLITELPDEGENEVGVNHEGKPTNAFYLLTAVLIQRKSDELEKQLKEASSQVQQFSDEITELRHERNTASARVDRAERRKDLLEEKLNAIQFNHEQEMQELHETIERQKAELAKLQELARSQSQAISSSQHENEEKLKRRIEELASLEVEYNTLKSKQSKLEDTLKSTKTQLMEAQNRTSEFQEVIRKLNSEKGELAQQVAVTKRSEMALKNTKESQQEMLETVRRQYREKLTEIDKLEGDLANMKEVYAVVEEQIELGKEEIDLLQKHNELLQDQILKEREKFAKQAERYTAEIQELNELIQMMQAIEEEQLELEAQATDEVAGTEAAHSSLRKDNLELKKRLHDTRMELSLLDAEKQLVTDQLNLLQEDFDFEKKQREQDRVEEQKFRRVLHEQIEQLQDRLKKAENLRLEEITNLETLKQRTFNDLQQQLAKEQSINQANAAKVKRLTEQNKELEVANHDLMASMAMMIKDSGDECKRIDELEDALRKSNLKHKQDAKTISQLQQQIQLLISRIKLKRPYVNTLPPPNPLVVPLFPHESTQVPEDDDSPRLTTKQTEEPKETTNEQNVNKETKEESETMDVDERETETKLLDDVVSHINELLPDVEVKEMNYDSLPRNSLLLCKLINRVSPGTIDERAINPKPSNEEEEIQNLNLCVNSAKAIGCDVPMIQVKDLVKDPSQLEHLTWEIVRTELLSNVSLRKHPELVQLQQNMELQAQIVDIQSLRPQELLLHWVNHHLAANEDSYVSKITNFEEDLRSLEVHYQLLHQLCTIDNIDVSSVPAFDKNESWRKRASIVNQLASLLNSKRFLYTKEVEACNRSLNVAFLANLFHSHSGLQLLHPTLQSNTSEIDFSDDHGTREERAFRLWINSLGIGTYVHNLQTDVRDGLILLKVFDKISPGIVLWHRVNTDPKRLGMYRKVENCTLCIKYGRDLGFSLVGIGGKDIFDGNRKFILALVWQMMQFHLLTILRSVSSDKSKKITETDVVIWANSKVAQKFGEQCKIDNLKSPKLQNSLFLAQLADSVSPGSVNFDFICKDGQAEELEENAKYVISVARKIGCCIFLVWEDIIELNHKMIFTLVATLMLRDSKTLNQ